MNKAQVFIRLHRPSTGSSLTVPATMNQEIDIEMALGLQELLIDSGSLPSSDTIQKNS